MYQPINCANVLEAVLVLNQIGIDVDITSVIDGLYKAVWHARFEKIMDSPLVIFDGAHNPEGVSATTRSIKNYFGSKKVYVLTGVMADKDYNYMAKEISSISDKVFCITPDNPRALDASEYKKVFENLGLKAYAFKTVKEACETAKEASKQDGRALFCLGSLYMYGEVVKHCTKKQ